VTDDFATLIDADVYLPESWLSDRDRCREAGIPDRLKFRPKWKIARDQLRHADHNGVPMKYLAADEEYGRCRQFRRDVAALRMTYVVEVPCSTTGWIPTPELSAPPSPKGARPPIPKVRPTRLENLWPRGGPPWKAFYIKDTDKGPVVWEARATRFLPCYDRRPDEECWFIAARNVLDGERKYFFSNAPPDTLLERMLHIGFTRARVERLFQDSKMEIGLDHFQVMRYRPLIRQLILSMISLTFLEEQRLRLTKRNPQWTITQVHEAIKVQLDPDRHPDEQQRLLRKKADQIELKQHNNLKSRRSHWKRRLRRLKKLGIRLSSAPRCDHFF
jgi:SRSO17 transposase